MFYLSFSHNSAQVKPCVASQILFLRIGIVPTWLIHEANSSRTSRGQIRRKPVVASRGGWALRRAAQSEAPAPFPYAAASH